jgi:hypothetical protein
MVRPDDGGLAIINTQVAQQSLIKVLTIDCRT